MSFWAKGSGANLLIMIRDENNQDCWNVDQWATCDFQGSSIIPVSLNDDWTLHNNIEITGQGNNIGIQIFSFNDNAIIDDIDLTLSTGGTNLFVNNNYDFEDWVDVPQAWLFDFYIGDTMEIEDDPENIYSGSKSVKIDNNETSFSYLIFRSPLSVSESFDLSFFHKSPDMTNFSLALVDKDSNKYYDFDLESWEDDYADTLIQPQSSFSETSIDSISTPLSGLFYAYITVNPFSPGTLWVDNFCISN